MNKNMNKKEIVLWDANMGADPHADPIPSSKFLKAKNFNWVIPALLTLVLIFIVYWLSVQL